MNNQLENIEQHFGDIAALIGEKARALMLWNLLDGRAYTATELAICADISRQSCSNHLIKLVNANLLTVEKQGRHRYYRFANEKVAQVIESIAGLLPVPDFSTHQAKTELSGIKYARTCYDHLAGKAGVDITQAMISKGILILHDHGFLVSEDGEKWFKEIDIDISTIQQMKRKFAIPCLDWSERKHHLGGGLGAALLTKMIQNDWLRKSRQSREAILTAKGKMELKKRLNLEI